MFLTLFVFLMKFADISKLHSQRCPSGDACNKTACWQHVARMQQQKQQHQHQHQQQQHFKMKSNNNSTSSGCDSNTSTTSSTSSKENCYSPASMRQQQNHTITQQQLEELRYYQQLQSQHLHVLQQQLLQRRRLLQQDMRSRQNRKTSATLTCNQQYLLQQRLQQQQQQQQQIFNNFNNNHNNNNNNEYSNYNENDILNNNNNNWNFGGYNYGGFEKGHKSRRGMTEFSTINDIKNQSHLSQPLQNSPRHHFHTQNTAHFAKHLIHANEQQQNHQNNHHKHNKKNNQQTLPLNSSANLNNITSALTNSPISSASHSPQHYRNPSNSPNNSPFSHAYYGENQLQQKQQQQQQQQQQATKSSTTSSTTTSTTAAHQRQYHQLQQHLRGNNRLPFLTQTQYQQYLNDLLLQQHNWQQQKQQLLSSKHFDEEDELSEESLKQNVAIVLNNLDRYNSALRSIILNEQVTGNSGSYFDENLLINDEDGSGCNNNFLLSAAEIERNKMATAAATPESDYNSNATTPGSRGGGGMLSLDSNMLQQQQNAVGGVGGGNNVGGGNGFCSLSNNVASNNLNCSLASSHDFSHDNSDYQWFLDYGYRDGCSGMQRSVLSSLSASYNGLGDLIYYEDLAKNLDANLAEVDMESFRAEDIHSLLSHLPSYCKSLGSENSRLQQSLLMQQQQQQLQHQQQQYQQYMYPMLPQQHGHNISQTSTTSTNELIDNSICKSELLFSPVKESHISVDSLDMDAYPEDGDIILTCKANKDNYTIAFEGSVLYSDESFYEPNEISMRNKQNFINLHSNLEDIVKRKALDVSMSRSDQAFTPNNKSQKNSTTQLQRYPSGNNNTSDAITPIFCHGPDCLVRKSNSLPNLHDSQDQQKSNQIATKLTTQFVQQQHQQQLNVSHAVSISTIMDCCKSRNLLPMCQIPISSCNSNSASITERFVVHKQQLQHVANQRQKHRCSCSHSSAGSNQSHNSTSTTTNQTLQQQQLQQQHKNAHISGSASSGNSSNPPAFNLVKLFIKQKSNNSSSDDPAVSAHTCMDVSSGCWPSSDAAGSSSSSSLEQRLRKKSMNDSGKGSALSRHEEEEDHLKQRQEDDSAFHLDGIANATAEDVCENSTLKRQQGLTHAAITNSPAHRRRSIPLRHPQLCQLAIESACSLQSSDGSRSNSEQLTQIQVSSVSTNSTEKKLRQFGSTRQQQMQQQMQQRTAHGSNTDMVTRSIQTSCGGSLSSRSSLNDRYRCVPPSFLSKLNLNGEEHAPIYVIYPNYALPDLGFVKTHASSTDVIFSTFNYKMAVGNNSSTGAIASLNKRFVVNADDDEILKTMDYKHIEDWESLATLLPDEYRKRLKHIPQVNSVLRQLGSEASQRPLFCMSPPVRRNRPNICDCAQFVNQQHLQYQTQEEAASSSGSSQQPSSGYRGSSTLLTDESQMDCQAAAGDPLKQMYVYQYEQQRMDSGVELSPASKMAPQPKPRGILRKSSSVTARTKRNSMIEEESKLTKLEKRRSLQEPPYQHPIGSSEEQLCDVFEEETELYAMPKPRKERLSRKELDARARAENFLSSLPRSELKHYAEIAAILESSEDYVQYDAAALKKEVSRVLSQQKKVSFNDGEVADTAMTQQQQHQQQYPLEQNKRQQRFSTPPNSPIISIPNGSRVQNTNAAVPRRCAQIDQPVARKLPTIAIDAKEQQKIDSNRFKRLQIQWELMSKDSNMLKELANAQETKSGGSTPTSATAAQKSRIPRPVSYPAGRRAMKCKSEPNIAEKSKETKMCCVSPKIVTRINPHDGSGKKPGNRSPSRIVPPKRYSIAAMPTSRPASAAAAATTTPSPTGGPTATTPTSATRARTPNSRVAVTAPNTPKRRVQSPRRTIPKVR